MAVTASRQLRDRCRQRHLGRYRRRHHGATEFPTCDAKDEADVMRNACQTRYAGDGVTPMTAFQPTFRRKSPVRDANFQEDLS